MPVWTADEVAATCDLKIHSNEEKATYMERFEYYGGIARSIFSFAHGSRPLQATVDGLTSGANFPAIIKALSGDFVSTEFPSGAAARIFKFSVPACGPFDALCVSLSWLSRRIEESFYERSLAWGGKRIVEFLVESEGHSEFAVMRANAFEIFAHAHLSRGGRFAVRSLGRQEISEIEIKEMKTQPLPHADIAALLPSHYGIPVKVPDCVPAFDSVVLPNRLYRLAVDASPPFDCQRLNEAIEQMGRPNVVNLFFVVPENMFPHFNLTDVPLQLASPAVTLRAFVLRLPLRQIFWPPLQMPSLSLSTTPAPVAPSRVQPSRRVKRKGSVD